MITKIACFTGHRPEKIFNNTDDIAVKLAILKRCIRNEIEIAINEGYTEFISGMARGTDIFSAELVLYHKQKYPNIKLTCALPFPEQGEGFSEKWRVRYDNIIEQCDKVVTVCDKFSKQAFMIRNRYMVDCSSRVIAIFNGGKGGTANTVNYAKSKGREIVIIDPNNML